MSFQGSNARLPVLAPGPRDPSRSSPRVLSSRKNSIACVLCRQAKRKCSGRPAPCRACQSLGADCVFDLSLDLRRKVAQRRTTDERDYYRDVLLSLLNALRSSQPERLNELVNFIRTSASMSHIATALADTTINLEEFSSIEMHSNANLEQAILKLLPPQDPNLNTYSRTALENLVDIPLFQVPAKPWTNVTDDDNLVSHLISLYFTWGHPCWQVVDQMAFLRHMRSGDMGSRYCTPFLVNSILAKACIYSNAPGAFAIPGNVNSCGSHFYLEAERLWKAEEGTACLANIQGLAIMCQAVKCQGKTEVSWLMLRQAVQLAQDFGMFRVPRAHADWKGMSTETQRVHAVTAWGVFTMNAYMSTELQKKSNLDLPVCQAYAEHSLADDTVWTPYPRSNQVKSAERPALLRYVAMELSNLARISMSNQRLSCSELGIDSLWEETNKSYSRLRQWHESLPDVLRISDSSVPHVLFLHIKYHRETISLFGPFLDHDRLESVNYPVWFDRARRIRILSAMNIAHCFRIYRLSYGHKRIPSHMLESANASLVVLMRESSQGTAEEIMELCRVVVAFSKRCKLARVMVLNIQAIVQQSGIVLPPEAASILEV